MPSDMEGRVALVTGGSRGIGLAVADALAARGADCGVLAREPADVEAAADRLRRHGRRVVPLAADVTDPDQVGTALLALRDAAGPVDVLVNCAGRGHHELFERTCIEDARAIVEVNLFGLIVATQAVLPQMRDAGGGHIVNVASIAGLRAFPTAAVYSAAKHAVVGLSDALRSELRPLGISVTVVCPDLVRPTGFFSAAAGRPAEPDAGAAAVPVDRLAEAVVDAIGRQRRIVVRPRRGWAAVAGRWLWPRRAERAFEARVTEWRGGRA